MMLDDSRQLDFATFATPSLVAHASVIADAGAMIVAEGGIAAWHLFFNYNIFRHEYTY
jgi:hypothetical protein